MPYTDWQTEVFPAAAKQEYGFVMSTTVDELSYMPSEQEKFRDAAQVVATGRKSWKTLKGKGEAVWPPLVEAALLEALEKYQPESVGSKSDKTLGRFPRRNRFISDYIFETTGKRRTPKQVGSRLQQLRDTCKKEQILQLISRRSTPDAPSMTSQSEGSIRQSPSPCPDPRFTIPSSVQPHIIHVAISLQSQLWPAPIPSVCVVDNLNKDTQVIQLSPSIVPSSSRRQSEHDPRSTNILSSLSRAIEFPSPWALAPESTFSVYRDDYSRPLHTETVPLKCLSSPKDRTGWLYTTDLAPQFWETLCGTRDVTKYTILQHLKPVQTGHMGINGFNATGIVGTIGVLYRFTAPERMPQKSAAEVGSMYRINQSRPDAQMSVPVSSAPVLHAQLSALNYSSSMFSPFGDNLQDNWVQPLSHNHREVKYDPHMNQPRFDNTPAFSYGPATQNHRMISSQHKDFATPRFTAPEPSFDALYQGGVDENPHIYAPVPLQHSQHFSSYSYS